MARISKWEGIGLAGALLLGVTTLIVVPPWLSWLWALWALGGITISLGSIYLLQRRAKGQNTWSFLHEDHDELD